MECDDEDDIVILSHLAGDKEKASKRAAEPESRLEKLKPALSVDIPMPQEDENMETMEAKLTYQPETHATETERMPKSTKPPLPEIPNVPIVVRGLGASATPFSRPRTHSSLSFRCQ